VTERGETIQFDFGGLKVQAWDSRKGTELKPLSALTADERHVHGLLTIVVGGRDLPGLGYFGSDDVCLADWLQELASVARVFQSSETGRHTFDEGEQGQPAFVFEREGDRGFVTVADSEISDGRGDPDWHRVAFHADELVREVQQLGLRLRDHLRVACPDAADAWLSNYGGGILAL
jgi:hypothetical protein